MNNDEFVDIKKYNGYYQINRKGQVRSLKRKIHYFNKKGKYVYPVKEKLLKSTTRDKNIKYLCVDLRKNKKRKTKFIHRLVAEAFILNPQNKTQVNHIDGNKKNNHVSNLEWCTHLENMQHAVKNKLTSFGSKNSNSYLTEKQVLEIRDLKGKIFQKQIAKTFSIGQATVSDIHNNKTWKHI